MGATNGPEVWDSGLTWTLETEGCGSALSVVSGLCVTEEPAYA